MNLAGNLRFGLAQSKMARFPWRAFASSREVWTLLCRTAGFQESLKTSYHTDTGKRYGQPTPLTHPHLLKDGEINVMIQADEFRLRRENLVTEMMEQSKLSPKVREAGIAIIPSATKQYMVDRIPYIFRQDTDFRYLTGCLQPDSVLVIYYSGEKAESHLFLKENTAYEERWEGARFGLREAKDFFQVEGTWPITTLYQFLDKIYVQQPDITVWYDFLEPRHSKIHKTVLEFINRTSKLHSLEPIRNVLHKLRAVKSAAEIQLMRSTCSIGAKALKSTISQSHRWSTESQILGNLEFECRMQGANHLAYPPVIASGNNANTIHYISVEDTVDKDGLILVDAGVEFHGYTSDVTRTWPAGGTFSPQQKCLYEIVWEVQSKLISSIEPNKTSIDYLYRQMLSELGRHLSQEGILPNDVDDSQASRLAGAFCPHNVGHHLGMDVHDCGTVPKSDPLVPGNVITVEPGIYIHKNNHSVAEEFRGIGIRIEDDILITETGTEVLTKDCSNTVADLEKLILG